MPNFSQIFEKDRCERTHSKYPEESEFSKKKPEFLLSFGPNFVWFFPFFRKFLEIDCFI